MSSKVGIVSLGCPKNQVDAEMLLFTLKSKGFELVNDPADADAIIVTSCLAERYKNEITRQLYEVDAALGIGANSQIADVVAELLSDNTEHKEKIEEFPDKQLLCLEGRRIQSTPPYTAYLKIAEGCDNRGKFRSRQPDAVVEEAEQLAKDGVKEIIVIAQDTTRYGEDLFGEPYLAKLLKRLCKIDGLKWIRVLYCYPDRLTDELIDTFAEEEKLVNYIDLPLQHCDGNILKRMNRHGNRESLTALLNKLRAKVPDMILRSTFITGFPGETDEQFEELAEFAAEIKFQRLGCFAYSAEEGTPAASFPDQIDDEIKQHRADIIMEHQQSVMAEYCESLIGKEIEVLVEGYDRIAECFYGRTYADAPEIDGCVFFTANGTKPQPGSFVKVKITDYTDCDPIGELAE